MTVFGKFLKSIVGHTDRDVVIIESVCYLVDIFKFQQKQN